MKILILGGGNMGKTYAESFTANHTVAKKDLYILEHYPEKVSYFKSIGFESVFDKPGDFIHEMNLIILAIKPQDTATVLPLLVPYMNANQLVLSIMAGVPIARIQAALPTQKVIRAMPNLPAQIGMGISGFTAHASVSKEELFHVQNLLNTTGKSLYFEDESQLDAVTAVSGSGPAYVYYFMDAMISKAMQLGFSQTESEVLVEQTFMGAIHLLKAHSLTCKEWMARVASKGGTTEAALNSFQAADLDQTIAQGLEKAYRRAIELGS